MLMKLVCSESSRVCSGRAIWPQGENSCCTRTESGSTRRRSTVTPTVAREDVAEGGSARRQDELHVDLGRVLRRLRLLVAVAAAEDEEEADGNGRQDEEGRRQDPPETSCHPPQIP